MAYRGGDDGGVGGTSHWCGGEGGVNVEAGCNGTGLAGVEVMRGGTDGRRGVKGSDPAGR